MNERLLKVLVVDPDEGASQLIARLLEGSGCVCRVANSTDAALEELKSNPPQVVLSEFESANNQGLTFCAQVRATYNAPFVFVSATSQTSTIVAALEAGADDFIRRPFDREELAARLRAVHRRASSLPKLAPPERRPSITRGPLHLDFSRQQATLAGDDLRLSAKEFALLYALASHTGAIVSRPLLFDTVWGDDVYDDSKTLDVHISRLRHKLDDAAGLGRLLKTIRRRGYLLSAELVQLDHTLKIRRQTTATG